MSIECRAAIADGNGNFKLDNLTIGNPRSEEVLVQMKASGLCHTDYDSMAWGKPIVMGHEGAGIVSKVGDKVSDFQPGDAVILNWATPCMTCFQCNLGNQHICENNSPVVAGANGFTPGHAHLEGTKWNDRSIERAFNIGTLSEYTLVKSSALVKFDASQLPFSSASIISCGVMTGYGSVINAAKLKRNSSVVVLGTGGVGLNVIQAAKISGASMIIGIDIHQSRLELARKFGCTHTLLAKKEDIGLLNAAREIKAMTQNRGADYAFECTAVPALGAAPLAMIRNAGMAVQVSGIEEEITFDMNLFEWDKVYINPLYGQCRPQIDFPKIVEHYLSGELLLDELVTQTYQLDHLDNAFEDLLGGKNAKGVILF